ncbi:winged helix-turn-helix transcriptional regulator [Streptosporangiaceae bacterium NEAU-GS5]|nr:winged helix-turn-helix transcriptional regulator [Streptosporangiaceae bacterium NEAU-GS5]
MTGVPTQTADRDVFAGIAHPTRRAILALLGERPRPVGELADAFDVSLPAISRHLRVLRESGLVQESVHGRYRVYELQPEPLDQALAWLMEVRGFWASRLESLGRYLHDRHQPGDSPEFPEPPEEAP